MPGSYAGPAKAAMFRAGLPVDVPIQALNRQCSSGSQSIATVAASLKAGFYQGAGLACGVESMSKGGGVDVAGKVPTNKARTQANQLASDTLIPMGITSENVAEHYGITREAQDRLAVLSHEKSLDANAKGYFSQEIVPVTTQFTDKEGKTSTVTVSADEGPRKGTNLQGLSKLRAVFKEGGSTTAGNASQVSDGAAATLLMKRGEAKRLGLPILGIFRGYKVVGVDPKEMGIGPAFAIPTLLEETGLGVVDVDVYEINEAFASQAVYCVEKLGIPMRKVNPTGGAISLGHPLGCTGNRMTSTLLHGLKRTNQKVGVVSMCIGTGMGAATLFERDEDCQ